MGAQYHNGHWYGGGQDIDIQSDPTATSFDPNKVPTGATAQSVLNSKIVNERLYSSMTVSVAGQIDLGSADWSVATTTVVAASCIGSYILMPFAYGGRWFLKALNIDMTNVASGTSIGSVYVYYMKK